MLLAGLHEAFPEWTQVPLLTLLSHLLGVSEHIRSRCKDSEQTLDVVEFYSGAGAIARSCRAAGLRTKAFDVSFSTDPRWD